MFTEIKILLGEELNKDIKTYCDANSIGDINSYLVKIIKQGHTIEKFGLSPITKTVEKIVEVPIEKIVEVPVNIVDSELLTKYREVTNNYENLQKENGKLKNDVDNLNKLLEIEKKINKKDLYRE